MSDYSLEMTAERIANPKTAEYFREVYSCYVSNNYRSAIVMLWSVVVCDLLFKLSDASALYGDTTAKTLLESTEKERGNDPKSPTWEANLLKAISRSTAFLDAAEYRQLDMLQSDRHFCAHPFLNADYELYSPSKEVVRAHIRSALDFV